MARTATRGGWCSALRTALAAVLAGSALGCADAPPPPQQATTPAPPFADERSAAVHFLQPIFPILDCTHIGEVEKGEVDEHFFQIFFYADRDHSRTITLQEYVGSVHESSPEKESYIFALMDADGSGSVSTREFRQYTFAAIDAADADRDGSVTRAEAGL